MFNAFGGEMNRLRQANDHTGRQRFIFQPQAQRPLQVVHCFYQHRRRFPVSLRRDPRLEHIHDRLISRQPCPALFGNAVALAAALFQIDNRIVAVIQPGQGRIDYPRAGLIQPAKAFFNVMNEFVPMARLFRQHRQEQHA
jgi:hypothetical protein